MCSYSHIMSLNKGRIVLMDKVSISYSRFKAENLGSSSVLKKKLTSLRYAFY